MESIDTLIALARLLTRVDDLIGHLQPRRSAAQMAEAWKSFPALYTAMQPYLLGSTGEAAEQLNQRITHMQHMYQQQGYTGQVLDTLLASNALVSGMYYDILWILQDCRDDIAHQRRQRWRPEDISVFPRDARHTLSIACQQTYKLTTIDDLFVEAGCARSWFVSPVERRVSQTARAVLGWWDGILLYAPTQEQEIITEVITLMLANPRLKAAKREVLQQLLAPESSVSRTIRIDLHPLIYQMAEPHLTSGHDDVALFQACVALSKRVQGILRRTDIDNTKLMQTAFGSDTPAIRLSSQTAEQRGWQEAYSSVFLAVRNAIAHGQQFSRSREQTLRWLIYISELLSVLEDYEQGTRP